MRNHHNHQPGGAHGSTSHEVAIPVLSASTELTPLLSAGDGHAAAAAAAAMTASSGDKEKLLFSLEEDEEEEVQELKPDRYGAYKGLIFIFVACIWFSTMSLFVSLLGGVLPSFELVFARSSFMWLCAIMSLCWSFRASFAARSKGWEHFWGPRHKLIHCLTRCTHLFKSLQGPHLPCFVFVIKHLAHCLTLGSD